MRFVLIALGIVFAGSTTSALGRMIQPDGSVVALAEGPSSAGESLLFPPQTLAERSWITLPVGSMVAEVEILAPNFRGRIAFPTVVIPGVRYAVEIPPHTFSLSLKGRWGPEKTLVRSLGRPGVRGQAWVTRSSNDLVVDLPEWKTATGFTGVLTLTRPIASPWKVTLSDGASARTFTFRPAVSSFDFSPLAWGFIPTQFEVTGARAELTDVRVRAISPQAPLPADPETLLKWPQEAWRDSRREWFSWTGTSVLVLITADYRIQDDYLKRLAFFVEKTGYRGRLVPEAELGPLHGWNAHDYAAPDLARFYTEAAAQELPLNSSEEELRDQLVKVGILVPRSEAAWEPGRGALVGISAASPPALRAVLFTHEAFHGLYYTSPEFRAGVASAWGGLSKGARRAFRSFLALSQYDPSNEALMVNEFQAYVLQRSSRDWTPFFRDRVLSRASPGEDVAGWLEEYLGAARKLDALVQSLYGLRSGDVSASLKP